MQEQPPLSILKKPLEKPAQTFKASETIISQTDKPKTLPKFDLNLGFGQMSTDHMLEIDWTSAKGWEKAIISKYKNFEIDPLATVFHYALECFEGLKAYKDTKGQIRLFRPELNITRLRNSCIRLGLPDFDPEEFLAVIKKFVLLEAKWIPQMREYSMYLRPTAISTWNKLGVGCAQSSKLFCIATPSSLYFTKGLFALKIKVERNAIRAHQGSQTGQYKLGSNYAHTIFYKANAIKNFGCNEILWTYNDIITELGAANLFIYWKNEQGVDELITHPSDDLILHGVTRESILELAPTLGINVKQRVTTFTELQKALKEGRLHEMFCCGTALIICSIGELIEDENTSYQIPYDKTLGIAPIAKKLREALLDIQQGYVEHPWSVVIQ